MKSLVLVCIDCYHSMLVIITPVYADKAQQSVNVVFLRINIQTMRNFHQVFLNGFCAE